MPSQRRPVITADDIRSASGELSIPPHAIVTPAATDLARELGVIMVPASVGATDDSATLSPQVRSCVELAATIDHTNLAPDATTYDIAALCAEARDYRFATVCINPTYVRLASQELMGSDVGVSAVVGFPTGAHCADIKATEAIQCVRDGATEIDMVANAGLLKSGQYSEYATDIAAARNAIGSDVILKVIIEAPLLDEIDIVRAGVIAADRGADFIKTSTGVYANARLEDVALLARAIAPHTKIKAAGGIRDAQSACAFLDAGASRIGTSAAVAMLWELPK